MAPAMNSVAYHSPSRRPNARVKRGRELFSLSTKDVSNAADSVQEFLLERPIDLLAQAADEHVDHVGLRVEAVVPDVRQDHRLRDDVAGIAHQVLEQRELARAEIDRRAAARH